MRKPFFRKQTKCWYVKNDAGEFIRLDPDEKTAFMLWSKMIEASKFEQADSTFYGVCQAWLREFQNRMSAEKHTDAIRNLRSFCEFAKPGIKTADVSAGLVINWLDSHNWSDARRADCARYIKKVVRWAFSRGWIQRNLLDDLRIPTGDSRVVLIDPSVHYRMVADCMSAPRSKPFGLVLIALHHTGARPVTIRTVEKSQVSEDGCFWIQHKHKTKGKTKRPLIVPLSPCMQTLTKILSASRSKHLFLNSIGNPWTKDAIVCANNRLRTRLGIEGVIAYAHRHTFATDALLQGQDLSTVAALLGHTSTDMVSRVYGHLDQHKTHLAAKVAELQQKRQGTKS